LFNATVNNISVIWWWSVLLVEETGVPEKTTDLPHLVADKLHHVSSTPCHECQSSTKQTLSSLLSSRQNLTCSHHDKANLLFQISVSYGHILLFIYLFWFFTNVHVIICTVKTAHAVNSIKQSPVLKGHLFLVLA
jgi:hypothetical protein